MERLYVWLNKIDYSLAFISAATIMLMMIWIFTDVILRYFFNSPLVGTAEVTGEYLLVIIVFLSISYTQMEEGHVSVDLLQRKLSMRMKKIFRVTTNIISFFIFILIGFSNLKVGLEKFENNIQSVGMLDYPIGPAYIIIFIGVMLMSIRLLLDSIMVLQNKKNIK